MLDDAEEEMLRKLTYYQTMLGLVEKWPKSKVNNSENLKKVERINRIKDRLRKYAEALLKKAKKFLKHPLRRGLYTTDLVKKVLDSENSFDKILSLRERENAKQTKLH